MSFELSRESVRQAHHEMHCLLEMSASIRRQSTEAMELAHAASGRAMRVRSWAASAQRGFALEQSHNSRRCTRPPAVAGVATSLPPSHTYARATEAYASATEAYASATEAYASVAGPY